MNVAEKLLQLCKIMDTKLAIYRDASSEAIDVSDQIRFQLVIVEDLENDDQMNAGEVQVAFGYYRYCPGCRIIYPSIMFEDCGSLPADISDLSERDEMNKDQYFVHCGVCRNDSDTLGRRYIEMCRMMRGIHVVDEQVVGTFTPFEKNIYDGTY